MGTTTLNVYGTYNYGYPHIQGRSATYSVARSGPAYPNDPAQFRSLCGQVLDGMYRCWQAGMFVDLTAVPWYAKITAATLTLTCEYINKLTAFTVELRHHEWGAHYQAADFIPGASLGNYALLASKASSGISAGNVVFTSESALVALIETAADRAAVYDYLSMVATSSRQRTGNAPIGYQYEDASFTGGAIGSPCGTLELTYDAYVPITIEADSECSYYSSDLSFLAEADSEVRCRLRANLSRPIGSELRAYDHAKVFKGILPAQITSVQRLDGANSISARIPWSYQKGDGTSECRADMVTGGWYAEYGGNWYRIQDFTRNVYGSEIPIQGVSAETELERFLTNYSTVPFSMPSHTPSEIMDAVLGGLPECDWYNGDFARLDDTGFPVGWEDTLGTWGAFTDQGAPGVRCTACSGGLATLTSWGLNHAAGSQIKLKFDFLVESGFSGTVKATLSWTNASGVESASEELEATYITTGVWTTFASAAWSTVLNEKCVLKLQVANNTDNYDVTFRSVRFVQNEDSTGWTYAGSMDTREPELDYNDPAIQLYGAWTFDHVNELVYSTTPTDTLARVFTGDQITVDFAAGGAGAKAKVRVDGATLVSGLSVATASSYSVTDLNRYRSHVLEVVVEAVKVSVSGLRISAENRTAVSWNRLTVYEAMRELKNLVGGEFHFETGTKYIYHDASQGDDVTAASILWLREGANLVDFIPDTTISEVKNSICYGGYGDGAFQIVVRADSARTVDGSTSVELYGKQHFAHTNKDVKDWASAHAEAQREVEKPAFPRNTYRATVFDSDAALLAPGDTVQVAHQLITTQKLRVLEISRNSDGSPASLLLGERTLAMDAAAQSETIRRNVDQLLRAH